MTTIRIVEGKLAEKITVLQKSNQSGTVMLVTELPWQEGLFGKIETALWEQEVSVENYLGRAAAIWTIEEDFTKEAGEFALALTLTGDEMIYRATGTLFIEAVIAAQPTEKISLFSAEEEERMTVDGATRKVTVPETLSTIGVEKDNNAQRIYFLCPRYFDGHDLSTCTRHYVNYLNLNETGAEAGQYLIDDVTVEGENMTFSWLVSNHVTQKPGRVAFILCFKEVSEEGEVTWEWNTEYNDQLRVLQGLEPGDAIAEQYPDILEQWLSKMENAAKGITFTPTVSKEGVLSWSNDGNLENPAPVDLKGPQGEKGDAVQVDTTLTRPGEAADAKVVGDELKTKLSTASGQMSGSINMSGNKITNLGTPTANGDAVPKSYLDARHQIPNFISTSDLGLSGSSWIETDFAGNIKKICDAADIAGGSVVFKFATPFAATSNLSKSVFAKILTDVGLTVNSYLDVVIEKYNTSTAHVWIYPQNLKGYGFYCVCDVSNSAATNFILSNWPQGFMLSDAIFYRDYGVEFESSVERQTLSIPADVSKARLMNLYVTTTNATNQLCINSYFLNSNADITVIYTNDSTKTVTGNIRCWYINA